MEMRGRRQEVPGTDLRDVCSSAGGKARRNRVQTQVLPDEAAPQSACCAAGTHWAREKGEGASFWLGMTYQADKFNYSLSHPSTHSWCHAPGPCPGSLISSGLFERLTMHSNVLCMSDLFILFIPERKSRTGRGLHALSFLMVPRHLKQGRLYQELPRHSLVTWTTTMAGAAVFFSHCHHHHHHHHVTGKWHKQCWTNSIVSILHSSLYNFKTPTLIPSGHEKSQGYAGPHHLPPPNDKARREWLWLKMTAQMWEELGSKHPPTAARLHVWPLLCSLLAFSPTNCWSGRPSALKAPPPEETSAIGFKGQR